jgi:uncharacterized protein
MDSERPLANVITLGVHDFAAQREFYRRLRWHQALDTEDFAVFELRGALLALFPLDQLAADAHVQPESARDGIRFSIIISAESAERVDEIIGIFRDAGGRVTKEPTDAEFFDGRSAYVADPEGNYWEVAWAAEDNPVSAAARRAAGIR